MILLPNTIGNSLAAYYLIDMLNENMIPAYEKHRLLSIFNSTIIGLKKIMKIDDPGFRARIVHMWKENQFALIDSQTWNPKIKSYFKNVINSHIKSTLSKDLK